MKDLIYIYFIINAFIAGSQHNENISWARTKSEVISTWIKNVLYFGFAIPYYVGVVLIVLLKLIYKPIDNYFQLHFIFTYYFTKNWDNVTDRTLQDIANAVKNVRNTGSIRDRIYRHFANILFKSKNFNPNLPKQTNEF